MPYSFDVLAPAKINLFLHVSGRKDNGYHTLQSHIMFADVGDKITIQPSNEYRLNIKGTFSKGLEVEENLVKKAVYGFCDLINHPPHFHITLNKNIPIGAGLGGGSSDAASVIRGLIHILDTDTGTINLSPLLKALGADVPACFYGQSCLVEGIGEHISPLPTQQLHALLVYPDTHCSTAQIFKNLNGEFSTTIKIDRNFSTAHDLISFIKDQRNDLASPAMAEFPEIIQCLTILEEQNNSLLTRMSGSGSTCFNLFENIEDAEKSAHIIQQKYPDWWVKPVTLK